MLVFVSNFMPMFILDWLVLYYLIDVGNAYHANLWTSQRDNFFSEPCCQMGTYTQVGLSISFILIYSVISINWVMVTDWTMLWEQEFNFSYSCPNSGAKYSPIHICYMRTHELMRTLLYPHLSNVVFSQKPIKHRLAIQCLFSRLLPVPVRAHNWNSVRTFVEG